MTTLTAKVLASNTTIANTETVYYTVPVGVTSTVIKKVTLCNTSAGAVTIDGYLVQPAGTFSTSNQVLKDFSLAAGATQSPTDLVGHVLSNDMDIVFKASTGSVVSLYISGTEIS